MERDGNTRAARWCAGCHDPVPFFSGAFDDPNYDDVNTASSQAGITCTACHAITHVNSTRGNADYTIEEPQHYPFAFSDKPRPPVDQPDAGQGQARDAQTHLPEARGAYATPSSAPPATRSSLPFALNHYQEFTRGQNHWDNFVLSGVSGGGARSFYYPPVAKTECRDCHMELVDSADFGARDFDADGNREIHDHMFLGGNTALPTFRGDHRHRRAAPTVPPGRPPHRPLRPPRRPPRRRAAHRPLRARRRPPSNPARATWSTPSCAP